MSVLEIDQHWPAAREALKADAGIVVTKDGEAIGRLVPLEMEEDTRPRFDPEKNRKRREKLWGKEDVTDTLSGLLDDREDRVLISESELAAWAAEGEEEASDANDEDFTEFSAASLAKWRNEVFGEEIIDSTSELMAQREDRCS